MNNFNEIKSCVDKTIVDYGGKFLFNEDYKIALVEAKKLFKIWTYEAEPFRFFSGIRTKIKAQLKKQFGLKGYKFEVGKSEKTEKKNIVIDAFVYKIWQEVIEEFGKKHTMSVLTLKEASFVEIANNIYRLEGINELSKNMIKMHIPTLQKMMTRKTGREITILLENEKIEGKQEEKKQDNIKDIFIPKGFKLVKIPRRHKRVNFVFDDNTYNKLKRVSKNNSVSMNELINQMINAIQEK